MGDDRTVQLLDRSSVRRKKTAPLARALIQRDAVEVGPTALTGDEAAEHSRYS